MKKFSKLALVAGSVAVLALPVMAQAQTTTPFSVESIGSQLGLGDADLKTTVLNIIRWLLGIMTLIAVVMIIYAGFVWLTAAGNEDNVDKAKKIISAAVIGLIVVLLAWAIVIFVTRSTANVTTAP